MPTFKKPAPLQTSTMPSTQCQKTTLSIKRYLILARHYLWCRPIDALKRDKKQSHSAVSAESPLGSVWS
jgi:hypothetical protein